MVCDECMGYDVKCIEYGPFTGLCQTTPDYIYSNWLQGQTARQDILRKKLIFISKDYSEKQLKSIR
jgi:hypothetical protein